MGNAFRPEEIDLAAVAAHLALVCSPPPVGAVVGRTVLRDAVTQHLGCSMVEAETLVDTMVARRFVVAEEIDGMVVWAIRPGTI